MRREQCLEMSKRSREISNTKVFEEPENDIWVSKSGSVYVHSCVCVRTLVRVCMYVCVHVYGVS